MLKHKDVKRFIALIEGWNARVWGERLLWETLEGLRDRPFKFLDPLSEEDLAVCRRLRDELKIWLYYDVNEDSWKTVAIEEWRAHEPTLTADDVRNIMERST